MRVLIVSWEYAPHLVGGLGKHVMELAPALAAEGVELHVITPLLRGGAAQEVTPEGIHVHRVEAPHMEGYGFITFADQVNMALERAGRALAAETGRFDLIHTHDWLTAAACVALKNAWRVPLIATIHATERGRGQGILATPQAEHINGIEWWLSYEAWRVIACSHFMAAQINSYFGAPADKIDVVPNGVRIRPSPFATEDERLAFRRRFASDDQPIAFYVGRLVFEKGLHVLLDAWPIVQMTQPHARLLIAGAGPCMAALKAQARSLDIAASVLFAGFIPDEERDGLYHIADIAVFPSLYEPFGMVALEAMAAHCPVVVTETGGLMEVVKLHETGLTVEPNNPASIAWGILHTLQHQAWARARAENAYVEAAEQFNWSTIAVATKAIYQRVLGEWEQSAWGKELSSL